jgi:hypothetical protein
MRRPERASARGGDELMVRIARDRDFGRLGDTFSELS